MEEADIGSSSSLNTVKSNSIVLVKILFDSTYECGVAQMRLNVMEVIPVAIHL